MMYNLGHVGFGGYLLSENYSPDNLTKSHFMHFLFVADLLQNHEIDPEFVWM